LSITVLLLARREEEKPKVIYDNNKGKEYLK
jgi:hypothetical protein